MVQINNNFMKVFLTALILIFSLQSWTKADDIRDFEIEGMSIGDSLLLYVSEKQIKDNMLTDYPGSKKFSRVQLGQFLNLSKFDDVQFHFQTEDKQYKIEAISAGIFFYNDFAMCLEEKKIIYNDIKNEFLDLEEKVNIGTHDYDNESKVNMNYLYFPNGGLIRIGCIDWTNKIENERGWRDHLAVGLNSEKFRNWKNNEAYN